MPSNLFHRCSLRGELWFWPSDMKISTYISRSRVSSLSVAWSSVWRTVNITSICGKGADHLVVRSVALLRFLLQCVSGQQLYCLWTCCQPTYWIISPQFNYLPYRLVSLSSFWLSLLSGLLLIIISDFLWGFCFWVFCNSRSFYPSQSWFLTSFCFSFCSFSY